MLMNPLALIGLAAVPALLTVYLLRNRVKHRTVSSLMLWTERTRMTNGGTWIQRNRLPLLFFLELLIILLLIWAAASPHILSKKTQRPLVIILDNSASMSATGVDHLNAAQRVLKKLPKLIRNERFSPVRIIASGSQPHWLSDEAAKHVLSGKMPAEWKLNEASFNAEKALLLARQNSTPSTKILVVSDRSPERAPESGNLRWIAAGIPQPNAGFVNAVRSGERCMVEITGSGTVEMQLGQDGITESVTLELPARKTYQLSKPDAVFEASLPDDALAIDNRITLLPDPEIRVCVQQNITHPILRPWVERAIKGTGLQAEGAPELIITDSTAAITNLDAWVLHLIPAPNAIPFTGPFVVDHDSPFMDGLSFEDLIWAAAETNTLPGMPIVLAGNTPLMTQLDDPSGRQHIYLQIDPALSTLHHSPIWPTLFWNLLKARSDLQPGFKNVNLRPGMAIHFIGDADVQTPEMPGVIEVKSNKHIFRAAFNFLDADESQLSNRNSADAGQWLNPENVDREYSDLAPLIIMTVIGLLTAHQFILKQEGVAKG